MATIILTQHPLGAPFSGTIHNANLQKIEDALTDIGPFILSGLVPSAGAGLTVSVAAGVALVGGRVTVASSFSITGLTASTTNHLYLLSDGTGTSNTTGTAPTNSVKLGTALTSGSAVTSVAATAVAGRQNKLQAAGTDLLTGLIARGLFSPGVMPINTNGAQIDCGNIRASGTLGGSGGGFSWANAVVSMPSDANYTLTAAEYICPQLRINSAVSLTTQRDIIVPLSAGGEWQIRNATTGGQAIRIIGASGTGIVIATARQAKTYCTGVNVFRSGPDLDPTV